MPTARPGPWRHGRSRATAALLAATVVWGSTFAVTKDALAGFAPAALLTWRFGLAAVVLAAVGGRRVGALSVAERGHATLLGLFLAAGFLLQTRGLEETLAGVSGFLTGLSVVLTPIAAAVFFARPVGRSGWVAVGAAATGLAVLSGGVSSGSLAGALLTIAGAVGITGHITGLSEWATPANALALTAWSVAVAASGCALVAGATGGLALPPGGAAWGAVAYLALAATCLGFGVQAWAQSALTATSAAVVMTMEPVFAAVVAALVGERGLGWLGSAGGLLVVGSMFLAELGPRQCCDAMAPRIECC